MEEEPGGFSIIESHVSSFSHPTLLITITYPNLRGTVDPVDLDGSCWGWLPKVTMESRTIICFVSDNVHLMDSSCRLPILVPPVI